MSSNNVLLLLIRVVICTVSPDEFTYFDIFIQEIVTHVMIAY